MHPPAPVPRSSLLVVQTLGGGDDGSHVWVTATHLEDMDIEFLAPCLSMAPSQLLHFESEPVKHPMETISLFFK